MVKPLQHIIAAILVGTLTACVSRTAVSDQENIVITDQIVPTSTLTPTLLPSPTPEPPRVLTVCMGQEPSSLFLYADTSSAAQGVLQAIYDGPFDILHGEVQPVILESIPTFANGGAELRPVEVEMGDIIMDAQGNWVSLQDGVSYRPSGCTSTECTQVYEGDQPMTMDELVARFRLLSNILWSDGIPLTAADSVFSFSIAQAFYGHALDTLRFTHSYTSLDERTVEWVSIPGYQGEYAANFFSPLPQHQLGALTLEELFAAEVSTRPPLGWGPYTVVEWVSGDHITLDRNPHYFGVEEGLPAFDHLVFRFVPDAATAVDALSVGECDYVDRTGLDLSQVPRILEAQSQGQMRIEFQQSASWEQIAMGIASLDVGHMDFFETKEVRQAITMCIDRQRIVDELLFGESAVPDGYLFPRHPLYNEEIAQYDYDPQAALELLATVGWADYDQNPSTPLTSVGAAGFPDGTPFELVYLIPEDSERQAVAQIVGESLSQCGVHVIVQTQPWHQFLAPGPEGLVFGRTFDLAEFAWSASQIPPCYLYLSEEIPGPYPEYPKGWGGGNLAGYSNPEFDQACRAALYSLPDTDEHFSAHQKAQAIFAEDIPAIPLYWRLELSAMRADMCMLNEVNQPFYSLSNLEAFDYGIGCSE